MFSHYDQLWEGRPVHRAAAASVLNRADTEPAITYEYEGRT